MKSVSMLEFRNNAAGIIHQIQSGQRMVLMYRGKPVIRLEPFLEKTVGPDDPFYMLYKLADEEGESLSNQEMDEIIYEP